MTCTPHSNATKITFENRVNIEMIIHDLLFYSATTVRVLMFGIPLSEHY